MRRTALARRLIIAAATAALVAGCSAGKARQGKLIDTVPRTASAAAPAGDPPPPTVQSVGLGTVDAPALTAYLNRVLDRLKTASPRSHVQARAYLAATYDLWPVAEADGSIFVPLGLVTQAQNEDEMAAALAHELSHVILQHHAADWVQNSQQQMLNATLIGMRYGAPLAAQLAGKNAGTVGKIQGTTKDVAKYWQYGRVGSLASKTLLQPAYTREQEENADLLGADLLIAAGYNVRAQYQLLEYVKSYEAQMEAPAAAANAGSEKAMAAAGQAQNLDDAAKAGAAWLGNMGGQLVGSAVQSASRQHESAEERLTTLKAYVDTNYQRAPRTPMQQQPWNDAKAEPSTATVLAHYDEARRAFEARKAGDLNGAEALALQATARPTETHPYPLWALYEVRLEQGQNSEAVEVLETAMKSPDPPLEVMATLSLAYLAANQPKQALAILDRADRRYRDPPTLLPNRIATYRALGRKGDAQRTLIKCEAAGSDSLKAECYRAAGEGTT